jgi:hypothetical protein
MAISSSSGIQKAPTPNNPIRKPTKVRAQIPEEIINFSACSTGSGQKTDGSSGLERQPGSATEG